MRGERVTVTPEGVEVALEHQGERIDGLMGDLPHTGGVRADGTRITAGVPDPVITEARPDPYAAWTPATDLYDDTDDEGPSHDGVDEYADLVQRRKESDESDEDGSGSRGGSSDEYDGHAVPLEGPARPITQSERIVTADGSEPA